MYTTSYNKCRSTLVYRKTSNAKEIDPAEKRRIGQELHELMNTRLFGDGPWLTDEKDYEALNKKLDEWGLQDVDPSDDSQMYPTEFGEELELPLAMVFLGLWHVWDIPIILNHYDLIDDETDRIFEQSPPVSADDPDKGDPETAAILRPIAQKAFSDYCSSLEQLA